MFNSNQVSNITLETWDIYEQDPLNIYFLEAITNNNVQQVKDALNEKVDVYWRKSEGLTKAIFLGFWDVALVIIEQANQATPYWWEDVKPQDQFLIPSGTFLLLLINNNLTSVKFLVEHLNFKPNTYQLDPHDNVVDWIKQHGEYSELVNYLEHQGFEI